uniref:Pco080956 n=1 Tax=Arundo donax TaxID=35708 RepID=A0A0A9DDX5_ARUDO
MRTTFSCACWQSSTRLASASWKMTFSKLISQGTCSSIATTEG